MADVPRVCVLLSIALGLMLLSDFTGRSSMGLPKIALFTGLLAAAMFVIKRYFGGTLYTGTERIDGKTVIVTGANSGVGKETAKDLARRGGRIILACRNMTKAEAAKEEIIAATQNKDVVCKLLDLASLASVRAFAEDIIKTESRLDILINNAGVAMIPFKLTEDGLETQMATNYFGLYVLTNLLLDKLKASAPSRVVIVSSIGHYLARLDFDNLNFEKGYSQAIAYCNSKLCTILYMRELVKKLEDANVSVNSLHPGVVETNLDANMIIANNIVGRIIFYPVKALFYKTPFQGAQSSLMAALDPKYATVSGKYLNDCKEQAPNPKSFDEGVAKKLWEVSEELTKPKEK